jgi:hypothetical protein
MSYQSSLLLNMTKIKLSLACTFWPASQYPFHVDNAADQSFLMLGYEPSEIESELHIVIINMRMKAALQQRIILKVHSNI